MRDGQPAPGGGGWLGGIANAPGNIGMPFGIIGNWKPKPGTAGATPMGF